MAYVNSTQVARVTLADRFAALVSVVREANARRAMYSQTLHELNNLSDRDLADLGISRMDIPHLAREAANQI